MLQIKGSKRLYSTCNIKSEKLPKTYKKWRQNKTENLYNVSNILILCKLKKCVIHIHFYNSKISKLVVA